MNRIWTKITGMALFLSVMLPEMALAAAVKSCPAGHRRRYQKIDWPDEMVGRSV